MKSTLRSVFLVALVVVGAASCAPHSSGSSVGEGVASGSGGTSSARGSGASGATRGSGGMQETSGAPGEGGKQATGGPASTGGKRGTGGARPAAGAQGVAGAEEGVAGAEEGGGGAEEGRGDTEKGGGGAEGTGGASVGDAGRGVPAKNDTPPGDTDDPKDAQGSASDSGIRSRQVHTRGYTFDVLESGSSGEPVLLLHGFPDTSLEWSGLMPVLTAHGYHCLAPDQRGYSPGARPAEVDAYQYEELVADAFAIGSELGERFHLVAHDWGANIAWLMLEKDPSRIASYTAIAVPHYQIWARAVYDDPDMASYLKMLNTWMAEGTGEAFWTAAAMKNMWTAKPADQRDATIAHMQEPGAMTAALNWYRASRGHKRVIEEFETWKVDVPTLLIFGTQDIGQGTVADTEPLMTGFFRVVQPTGAHFIVDEQPKAVADETLAHLQAYPIR